MEITNWKVHDFIEAIVASGFPMQTTYTAVDFAEAVINLKAGVPDDLEDTKHYKRMCNLADTPAGSGHSNFLSGIIVTANITATVKWWEQFQRYHFKQIVSSMSTMHRLRAMARTGTLKFNALTPTEAVESFTEIAKSDSHTDEELAYACPMGLELTARVVLNYLQLRTQYMQRKHHKLQEWRDYCAWIEKLPYAKELITCGINDANS